jgi:CO/xanthine dehydrogenase FAD-binding subunit
MMDFNTISPQTTTELFKAIEENQGNNFRFGAGYTDLILELEMKNESDLTVINLAQLDDDNFTRIRTGNDGIKIGSLTTMTDVLANKNLQKFPVLTEAVESVASFQIRSVATVGGNICTASPAGDVSCALVSLNAICELINSDGEIRTISLAEFFTGVKTTVLEKNEILRNVFIPTINNHSNIKSGFVKIGNRNSMEIALASLAYHLIMDKSGVVFHAGVAIGSVAKTIMFTETACDFIIGKNIKKLTKSDKEKFSDLVLDYANPISDIRASAWYRRQVLENISKEIL